ncbi:MAG: hypothetical protein RLZZ256_730 [Bacteroidota bacterium]|jgi:hypothetical protein
MRISILLFSLIGLTLIACKKDTPTRSASITSVKVTAWPTTNASGAPWDATSSADLFVQLLKSDLSEVPNDPLDDVVFPDAIGTIARTLITPYRIPDPTATYYIQLLDNDELDADDEIGVVDFDLDNHPDQPAVIFKTVNGITMEIGLQWN